jgi:hypothetical protein
MVKHRQKEKHANLVLNFAKKDTIWNTVARKCRHLVIIASIIKQDLQNGHLWLGTTVTVRKEAICTVTFGAIYDGFRAKATTILEWGRLEMILRL